MSLRSHALLDVHVAADSAIRSIPPAAQVRTSMLHPLLSRRCTYSPSMLCTKGSSRYLSGGSSSCERIATATYLLPYAAFPTETRCHQRGRRAKK